MVQLPAINTPQFDTVRSPASLSSATGTPDLSAGGRGRGDRDRGSSSRASGMVGRGLNRGALLGNAVAPLGLGDRYLAKTGFAFTAERRAGQARASG